MAVTTGPRTSAGVGCSHQISWRVHAVVSQEGPHEHRSDRHRRGCPHPMGRLLGSSGLLRRRPRRRRDQAALERSGVSPDQVDYVIMGQVIQAGAGQITARQAGGQGRHLDGRPRAHDQQGLPVGLDAIALADQLIRAGEFEIVVAGGMESMTQAPHLLPALARGFKYGDVAMIDSMAFDALTCAFDQVAMGISTENHNARPERHARGAGRVLRPLAPARRGRAEETACSPRRSRPSRSPAQGRPDRLPRRRGHPRRHHRRVAVENCAPRSRRTAPSPRARRRRSPTALPRWS